MEIRIKNTDLLISSGDTLEVKGYINVTNRESEILYSARRGKYFKEVMCSGVFKRALEQSEKIPLLFEHNWNKILASTEDNSLELSEDNIGLRFSAKIKNREIYDLVKQGSINSCSFGFRALSERVEKISSKLEKRFVDSIELMEVSLVKNPAYVGSLCETRSATDEQLVDLEKEVDEVLAEETNSENVNEVEETIQEENVQEAEINQEPETTLDETSEETNKDEEVKEEVVVVEEEVASERNMTSSEEGVQAFSQKEYVDKNEVFEIVDELIDKKLSEINKAEQEAYQAQEQLNEIKEIHTEIENSVSEECMKNNAEVIRLRLELLKLNDLKKGIRV